MANYSAENFEIRGSLKSVIGKLFTVIFLIFSAFCFIALILEPYRVIHSKFWGIPLMLILFFTLFGFWIFSQKITVYDRTIEYKYLISRQSVKLSDIKRTKYLSSYRNHSERWKNHPRIILYPSMKEDNDSIDISLIVFRKEDLQNFFDLLESIDKLPFKRNVGKK